MKEVFFIPGPLPGMNEIIDAAKTFRNIPSKNIRRPYNRLYKYTEFKEKWNTYIKARIGKSEPMKKIWINFIWIEPDRKRDPDNIAAAKKFILDGMILAGLIKNDGWNEIAGWIDRFHVTKQIQPGCLVLIQDYEKFQTGIETQNLIERHREFIKN